MSGEKIAATVWLCVLAAVLIVRWIFVAEKLIGGAIEIEEIGLFDWLSFFLAVVFGTVWAIGTLGWLG